MKWRSTKSTRKSISTKSNKRIWCFLPILLMVRLVRAVMWQKKKEGQTCETEQKLNRSGANWIQLGQQYLSPRKKYICLTTSWYRILNMWQRDKVLLSTHGYWLGPWMFMIKQKSLRIQCFFFKMAMNSCTMWSYLEYAGVACRLW